MFNLHKDQPDYAFLPKAEAPETNQYGKAIELVDDDHALAGKSLNINGNCGVSDNPDRHKQHGFYFNADNCIGCHACESACSEKNDLSPHIAFRSVGYIEGGTYPDYHRMNISMSCNHCDDPVCLKGCPTRAYTKFAEYGAVLQDPDICFGCGYCTWVCPYNAPQLDPVKGEVEKCNMCVDRLEVGLKPSCVAACLAGALDFGVIETTPENREQLKTQIPGFPTPDITHPNIRFEQKKSLPREMTRPDAMPVRYERDEQGHGHFKTKVRDSGGKRQWNIAKLQSRENPLVIFTLITQAVVGCFAVMFLGPMLGLSELSLKSNPVGYPVVLFLLLAMETFALVLSTMHLGKPHRFYRAFYNLRYSPVSREVAGLAVFYNLLGIHALLTVLPIFNWLPADTVALYASGFGWAALLAGPVALYFMCRIYRIKARPFWDHWQVFSSFFGNMLTLGSLLAGGVFATLLVMNGQDIRQLMLALSIPMFAGLLLEFVGLWCHARALMDIGGEAAASHYDQTTRFGHTYWLRNIGLLTAMLLIFVLALTGVEGWLGMTAWYITMAVVVITALIGRALFYVLVIPTTMPGAFFWRNKGFEEHACETGLANMPQVGVMPCSH